MQNVSAKIILNTSILQSSITVNPSKRIEVKVNVGGNITINGGIGSDDDLELRNVKVNGRLEMLHPENSPFALKKHGHDITDIEGLIKDGDKTSPSDKNVFTAKRTLKEIGNHKLPIASNSKLGGVIIGDNLTVDEFGRISAVGTSGGSSSPDQPSIDIIPKDSTSSLTDTNVLSSLRSLFEIRKRILAKDDESTALSDDNMLSSLRTVEEIEEAIEDTLVFISENYLSKVKPDQAQEIINFLRGLTVGDNKASIDANGNTSTINLVVKTLATIYDMDVQGVATLFRTIVKDYVSSDVFIPGLFGEGFKLYKDGGDWNFEIDNAVIRKGMTIFELIISKVRSVNGGLAVSPGNGRIKSVAKTNSESSTNQRVTGIVVNSVNVPTSLTWVGASVGNTVYVYGENLNLNGIVLVDSYGNTATLSSLVNVRTGTSGYIDATFHTRFNIHAVVVDGVAIWNLIGYVPPSYYVLGIEGDIQFLVNDLVRCDVFSSNQKKHYWVEVKQVTGDSILCLASDFGSVVPAVGDDLVQFGNTTNKNRQGIVYITASEDGKPRVQVLDGVNTTNLTGKSKAILGCLDGITDTAFPADYQPSGYSLYAKGAFIQGIFLLRSGKTIETEIEDQVGVVLDEIEDVRDMAEQVGSNVSDLSSYVDGAFKDGVIDGAEAKAIEKYLNTLDETMSQVEATYNKIYVNEYLTGSAKTNLYTAINSLTSARDNLRLSINNAIADGKTTAIEKADVDSKFSTFNARLKDFQSAVEDANKAIQTNSMGSIQVGGRNLLLNSKGIFNVSGSITDNYIYFSETKVYLEQGKSYILTGKTDGVWTDVHGGASNNTDNALLWITNSSSVHVVVSSVTTGAAGSQFTWQQTTGWYFIRLNTYKPNATKKFWELKIESGNKPTDWTEAPEDAEERVKLAQDAATAAKNAADGANSLLADIANDNKLTPSEKYETKREYDIIASELQKNIAQANTFGVSTSAYVNAFNAITSYLTPLFSNLAVTSDIVGATFRATFKTYYDARTDLLNAIAVKAKQLADEAINLRVTTTVYNSGIQSLSDQIALKVSSTTFNSLTERVSTAEQKLTDESIKMTVKQQTTDIAAVLAAIGRGKMLHRDPTFKTGNNDINVYNNEGNGTVTHARVSGIAGNPNDSGYCLRIATSGAASPGHGGFYFGDPTRANAVFITRIIANIPVGCHIGWASNATGDGRKEEWLTSQDGVGTWKEYILKLTCGGSGSFSSTNFFALVGGSNPTWYLAFATSYDITGVDDFPTMDDIKKEVKAGIDIDANKVNIFGKDIYLDGNTIAKAIEARQMSIAGGKILLNPDGSGQLANGNVKWNAAGETDFSGVMRLSTNYAGNISDANLFHLPATSTLRTMTMGYELDDIGKVVRLFNAGSYTDANYRIYLYTFGILADGISTNATLGTVYVDIKPQEAVEFTCFRLPPSQYSNVYPTVGKWYITSRYAQENFRRSEDIGRFPRLLATGRVTVTSSTASLSLVQYYDSGRGNPFSVTRLGTGQARISWNSGVIPSGYIVMLTGYGGVDGNASGSPLKGTLQYQSTNYFDIWISDDASVNNGACNFMIFGGDWAYDLTNRTT